MVQCEECIHFFFFKKRIKRKKGKSKDKRKEEQAVRSVNEGEEGERERGKLIFLLLSKIYINRIVGFSRRKMQSRSTHRWLCVGTKILKFRQTPRSREFFYFGYF